MMLGGVSAAACTVVRNQRFRKTGLIAGYNLAAPHARLSGQQEGLSTTTTTTTKKKKDNSIYYSLAKILIVTSFLLSHIYISILVL